MPAKTKKKPRTRRVPRRSVDPHDAQSINNPNAKDMALWRSGADTYLNGRVPSALRIRYRSGRPLVQWADGGESVPLEAVRDLLHDLKNKVGPFQTLRSYSSNFYRYQLRDGVHPLYDLNGVRVNKSGTIHSLHIGCKVIPFAAVRELMKDINFHWPSSWRAY